MAAREAADGENGAPARAAVLVVLLVALLTRIPFLFGYGVDDDEFYTLRNAENLLAAPVPDAVLHYPLSFAVVRATVEFAGVTPLGLRLFSVLCGVLAPILLLRFATRVVDARSGFLGAMLLAAWPWHQYFSGLARYYAPVFLFALIALDRIERFVRGDRRALFCAGCAVGLGALVHPSALLGAGGMLRVLPGLRGRSAARALGAVVVAGIALALAVRLLPEESPIRRVLTGAAGHGYDAALLVFGLGFNLTPVLAVLALLGAREVLRDGPGGPGRAAARGASDRRDAGVYLILSAALPVAVLAILALLGSEVQPRYAMAGMPAVLVLAGAGAASLAPRGARVAAPVLACLLPLVPGLVSNLADGDRHPYAEAARWLRTRLRAGDYVFAEGHGVLVSDLYGFDRRLPAGAGDPPFPSFFGECPPDPGTLEALQQRDDTAYFVLPENIFADPRPGEAGFVRWLRERGSVRARLGDARFDYHRNVLLVIAVGSGARA